MTNDTPTVDNANQLQTHSRSSQHVYKRLAGYQCCALVRTPVTNFRLELVASLVVWWYRRVVATRPNTSENMAAPLVHMESRYIAAIYGFLGSCLK